MITLSRSKNNTSDAMADVRHALDVELAAIDTMRPSLAKTVATESYGGPEDIEFDAAIRDLDTVIMAAMESLDQGIEDINIGEATLRANAAAQAAMLATNPRASLEQEVVPMTSESKNLIVIGSTNGGMTSRSAAVESFDDTDTNSVISSTILYNLSAPHPEAFTRSIFPTILLDAGKTGINVTADLLYVQNDNLRDINGKLANFNRVNLTRAMIDDSILESNPTKVIPVWRASSADNFTDVALVPSYNVPSEGELVPSAPLKPGKRLDLIGLSQTDALLNAGVMTSSDQLDIGAELNTVYIKVGADILSFPVAGITTAKFVASRQESTAGLDLVFNSPHILISAAKTNIDLSPLVDLAAVAANDLKVYLQLDMSGSIDIDSGTIVVFGSNVSVAKVYDAANNEMDLGAGAAATVAAAIGTAEIIGYTVNASRSNSNRRQKGQTIGHTSYTEQQFVPLSPPITAERAIHRSSDSSDLSTLIKTTHIRINNATVRTLIETADTLREYVANGVKGERPSMLGIGRLFVEPTFVEETIDVLAEINSVSSFERSSDLKAVLINRIRDIAAKMYIDSELGAARAVLGVASDRKMTVNINTDPYIASHLYESGDDNLLTHSFNWKITHTPNEKMKGKIFLSFSMDDENSNTKPNPLNLGFLSYGTETVYNTLTSRNGEYKHELCVVPRFKHIITCPILAEVTVVGITEALKKV